MSVAAFNASRIPNVGAARLAAIHQAPLYSGLDLFTHVPDRALISVVFSWDLGRALDWADCLTSNGAEVAIGGPGHDEGTLREVEGYPLEGFPVSHTSVGCTRRCPWYIVPRQYPGGLRELDDWRYAPVMLDSNILATSPGHRAEVVRRLAGCKVSWEGGLDARLVDRDAAAFVAATSTRKVYLAWDSDGVHSSTLADALQLLEAAGFNRRKIVVYVLAGYDGGWESAYLRVAEIKSLGATPYVQLYQPLFTGKKVSCDPVYRDLQRWCNRPAILWSVDFTQYHTSVRHRREEAVDERQLAFDQTVLGAAS